MFASPSTAASTAPSTVSSTAPSPAVHAPAAAIVRAFDPARRRARTALLVLLALAVLVQPLSVPWIDHSLGVAFEGIDAHSQWSAYLAGPAPDVLFLGGSNARMDVDGPALGRELTRLAGRPVSVGKLGVNAAQYDFLDALTGRVLARPDRPRTIVFTVTAIQFNANFDCATCGGSSGLSQDLWEISSPLDPAFLARAFSIDPDRVGLAGQLLAPAFTHPRQAVAGVECPLVRSGRRLAAEGRIPVFPLLTTPTACDVAPRPRLDEVMTPAQEQAVATLYTTSFIGDYAFSDRQAGYLRDMVRAARAAGVRPLIMLLPEYGVSALAPAANRLFQARMQSAAGELGVPFVDLGGLLNDDAGLWTDQLHLNRWGAAALAPPLAAATWRAETGP